MIGRRLFNVFGKSYKRVGKGTVVEAEKLNISWWTLPCGRGSVTGVLKVSPFLPNCSTQKPVDWVLKKGLQ